MKSITFALEFLSGLKSYNPFLLVIIKSFDALTIIDTIADKRSLSPNFNSSVATISFSLITGIIFCVNNSFKACVVLMNCSLSSIKFFVIRTCAIFKLYSVNIL